MPARGRIFTVVALASCVSVIIGAMLRDFSNVSKNLRTVADAMQIIDNSFNPIVSAEATDSSSSSSSSSSSLKQQDAHCYDKYLPDWVLGDPEVMAHAFKEGSTELSDKYDDGHRFFYAYQPYLSKLVLNKLESQNPNCQATTTTKPKIKFLEIGLGCHPKGGMKRGTPGGSALGWRAVFKKLEPVLDLDLHIMEYDAECALNWHKDGHEQIAGIHTGDASSETDLARVVQETGSANDFDVIIDDASHINWHMIKTLEIMMSQIQMGGMYVVEDIWSSCRSWKANEGTKLGEATGGTRDCMKTSDGNPTFFAKVVEWQKELLLKKVPFKDVNHIDFHGQIVVFEKGLPQNENKWITKSS